MQGRATVLWAWRTRTEKGIRVYQVAICQGDSCRTETVNTLHDVGMLIKDGTLRVIGSHTWVVACEDVHVGRNVKGSLRLARTGGKLIGPSVAHSPGRAVIYMQPSQWRKATLPHQYKKLVRPVEVPKGKKPTASNFDKAASLKFIPPQLPPLALWMERVRDVLGVRLTKLDHCTDAGGVALWSLLQ